LDIANAKALVKDLPLVAIFGGADGIGSSYLKFKTFEAHDQFVVKNANVWKIKCELKDIWMMIRRFGAAGGSLGGMQRRHNPTMDRGMVSPGSNHVFYQFSLVDKKNKKPWTLRFESTRGGGPKAVYGASEVSAKQRASMYIIEYVTKSKKKWKNREDFMFDIKIAMSVQKLYSDVDDFWYSTFYKQHEKNFAEYRSSGNIH